MSIRKQIDEVIEGLSPGECIEALEKCTLDEIKEYIEHERKTGFRYGRKYRSHDLIPSFYLAD